jgi:transposase
MDARNKSRLKKILDIFGGPRYMALVSAAENIPLDDMGALRRTLTDVAHTQSIDELISLVITLLVTMSGENKRMALRLQKALRSLHCRKSEKLSPGQLVLFREMLDQYSDKNKDKNEGSTGEGKKGCDSGKEGQEGTNKGSRSGGKPKKKPEKGHGRQKLPDDLPRVDNLLPVPDAERVCSDCGAEKICIGHSVSERLNYVPASLQVVRDIREKMACKPCQGSVSIAPAAAHVVEKGLADEGLLAHVVVSKYVDGLPLTRQSKIFARIGVKLAPSTLGDFVRQTTMNLGVLAEHIKTQVFSARCVQQDDTGIAVLDKENPNGVKRGHIFANVGNGFVFHKYTPDWKGIHPTELLRGYSGIIQGDGYAGINGVFSGTNATAIRAGCMMHCRRYFFEAHKAGDPRAGIPLALIGQLYEIERQAKDSSLAEKHVKDLRAEKSLPLMAQLKAYIDDIGPTVLPKSDMGKAVRYAQNQWPHLLVPFSHGFMEIDNGEAERQLRLLAIGRRNWLFAGSDKGGERAAAALTVLGTAVWQGVNPLDYLTAVLRAIARGHQSSRIGDLLPLTWAKQHGQKIETRKPILTEIAD